MKPWPSDAVIIVAARAGEQRPGVRTPFRRRCRDCGAVVVCSHGGISAAANTPSRRGRPIAFFCPDCTVTYDRGSIDVLHDLAGIVGGTP